MNGKLLFSVVVAFCFPFAVSAADHAAGPGYSADEVLARLKNGNLRFVEGKAKHPHADAERRSETVKGGQHPMAIVIACADSREPVEILFDQGIGDVFTIRVAGNVCCTNEIGSAEYAAEHLGTPICLVLGHTGCGAVTAAATEPDIPGNLGALIDTIRPSVAIAQHAHPELKGKDLVPSAVEANIRRSMANLKTRSEGIGKLVAAGKLRVVGALYDLESGQVKWLDEGGADRPVAKMESVSKSHETH